MKKVRQKKKIMFASMLILMVFLYSGKSNAQGRANVWYFGTKAGLNFNTTPPTTLSDGAINNNGVEGEGSSAISDVAGNLLFYSNGVTVWNRNHVAMTNGTGLMGNVSSTQSAVIIPRPGSTTQYYLFTAPATNTTNQVRWNLIDMSLSAGLGDVVAASKNQVMPSCPTYMMEALTIVPHFNGTDYWAIAHAAANAGSSNSTNTYYVWPITSAGVGAAQTYSVGYSLPSVFVAGAWVSQGQGIIKSNTCFTKLFTSYYAQGASGLVDMVNFNNSTGVVSGAAIAINNLEDPNRVYGIEVSPNDQFLYVSLTGEGSGTRRVYQFDVSSGVAATINASRYTVASAFAFNPSTTAVDRVGQLQLGPDGKIYITLHQWNVIGSGGRAQLAAIRQPNLAGAASDYNEDEVIWTATGVGTTMGLPQFTKSFVGGIVNALANKNSICTGQSINFSYTYTGVRVTVAWDINKDGTTDYTTDAPSHTYSTAGTYWSKVTITDNCGRTAKDSIQITVLATAAPTGAISCGGSTMTLGSSHANCVNFKWYKRVTSGATYDSLLGTGCSVPLSYPNASQAPTSVWVEDATGETVNAALGTSPVTNYPYDKYITSFTVSAPLRLSSVRYRHNTDNPNCTSNNTITIRLGATVIYSRTFASAANPYCDPTNIPIDLTLSPGSYTIEASRTNGQTITSFSNPSIAGLITVNNDGPFYNFITSTVTLCPNRVQINRLCSLPIELIHFTGKKSAGKVKLDWATSIEIDNSHFILERSADGVNYTPLAQIKGAGNSSVVINYSWDDFSPLAGTAYYRLIQYDLDGQSRTAGIVKVSSDEEALQLIAYPNPFNHSTSLHVISEEATVVMRLMDINGKVILEDKYFETNQATELGAELSSGVYLVQVSGAGQNKNFKLIKE